MRSNTRQLQSAEPMPEALAELRSNSPRAPIAILGIPFDNITGKEAIAAIEEMIRSRQSHYLVTANVDFLVQSRSDVELRRILTDAQLVLCDGTPLVWASRWLGNRLPERVAGADLVPLLIKVAAQKGYRLFLLGASEQSASRAAERLQSQYPSLVIAGRYSPSFAPLLEMDHEDIKRRIIEAKPDILLVSFGCPKQEKWMWMHYRSLGVPVCVGVGATIDFLAGYVKRAPRWMQRTGVEWMFRLAQEPRRLFKRYAKDLWVFAWAIMPQWWHLHTRRADRVMSCAGELLKNHQSSNDEHSGKALKPPTVQVTYQIVRPPEWLDSAAVMEHGSRFEEAIKEPQDCVLPMRHVRFVDSTGVGFLIKFQKRLRSAGKLLVILTPSPAVKRALSMMRLEELFCIAADLQSVERILQEASGTQRHEKVGRPEDGVFQWSGEVTAASVDELWKETCYWLGSVPQSLPCVIDLSLVPFIDSSGLGLMVRAKKQASHLQRRISFSGLRPPVRNVVKLANLEQFLLSSNDSEEKPLTLANPH